MKYTNWISLALVLCMVLCLLPAPVSAATLTGYCGDNVQYAFNESTGKMTISGTGDMKSVTNSAAPYNHYWDRQEIAQKILTVEIKSGVTSVGAGAFFYCTNLTSVILPSTVTKIGRDAFYNADSLSEITFPAGLTEIGVNAFLSSGLEKVIIPAGVKEISDQVFYECGALESVVFQGTMTRIGTEAFYNCNSLKSVKFEAGMENGMLDELAFAYCEELVDLVLPQGLVNIRLRAFEGNDNYGADLVIPETVESIGDSAFRECMALTTVTIPKNVNSLGDDPFIFCNGLKNATMYSETVDTMKYRIFRGSDSLEYVHIIGDEPTTDLDVFGPQDDFFLVYYDRGTSGWEGPTWNGYLIQAWGEETPVRTGKCGENVSWTLDGGLLTISGQGPTYDYSGFEENSPSWLVYKDYINEVVIEEGVTAIGKYLFCKNGGSITDNYPYLTSVSIPSSVTSIADYAFEHCMKLEKVQLSEGLQSIGNYAFHYCESLSDIKLPSTLTSIGSSAFQGALKDVAVVIPAGVTEIADSVFYQSSLTGITFPENLTAIGVSAFNSCWYLTEMSFTGKAPEIKSNAFYNVTATAYYPGDLEGWTEAVQQSYGGTITWVSTHTHSYTAQVVAPTCTEKGYTLHTCRCGDSYKDTYVDALGHEFGAPAFDEAEKCHVSTCTVCGATQEESCTFDGGTVVTEATMDSFGTMKYTCTVCGGSYQAQTVYRVFGAGRSETAIAAAEELKAVLGVEKFDSIILAGGEGFADALAGSYLAVQKDAPILLVRASTIELNKNYVLDNLAENGTVYILGGPAAVSQEMEDALVGLNVVRLQGDDRFLTNLKILEEAGIDDEEILICTGWNFADSLSASATGLPILMLNTSKNELTAEQTAFLEKYADNEFTIIGGTAAVSEKLEADVEAIVGEADRVSGSTREETSVKVAKRYFSVPDYAVVAYSRNFPDGLCGGPLAHALKAPLLLVNVKCETPAADYIESQGITQGFVLGGTAAVSEDSARIVFDLK